MRKKLPSLLALGAALALSACANNGTSSHSAGGQESAAEQPAQSSARTDGNGACRSIGEGRKINGKGKNDGYMCSAKAALNSAEAKELLNPAVKVSYGSVGKNTAVSRQVANAVGKSVEETCQRAFLNTVKRFQSTAANKQAKSVRLVSYFDKQTKGGSEYECHIGTWNSRVVLKGSFH